MLGFVLLNLLAFFLYLWLQEKRSSPSWHTLGVLGIALVLDFWLWQYW